MPSYLEGDIFCDDRGKLFFNNEFDLSVIKRMYFIENKSLEVIRAWQGHRIEKRWFVAVKGSFKIDVVKIDDWHNPSDSLNVEEFFLDSDCFKTLFVEEGHATSIQSLKEGSRLLCLSDYTIGSVEDNYKFHSDKWKLR